MFGMDIKKYRDANGLSQAAFAALLTGKGYPCGQSLVSQWETGETRLTAEWARDIEIATDGASHRLANRPDIFGPIAQDGATNV